MKSTIIPTATKFLAVFCLLQFAGCSRQEKAALPPAPPPISSPSLGQAVPLGMKELSDQRLTSVAPVYPYAARKRKESADVTMQVTINEVGRVVSAIPYDGTDPSFADSAVTSVKQWRYKPYMLNGHAAPMRGPVTIHFRVR